MQTHNEIEFKTMLTKNEYDKLFNQFSELTYSQTNHYLDDELHTFSTQKIGCRIRIKHDQYEVTLKKPISEHVTEERNWSMTREEYTDFLTTGDLSSISTDFTHPMIKTGSITTTRSEWPYKDGVMMLDHSQFFGQEDFELEYEVHETDQGLKDFQEFLNQMGIPYRKAEKKLVRMLNAKG